MKRILSPLAFAFALVLSAAGAALADDLAAVVNRSNPIDATTVTELRKVLLGQQRQWSTGKKMVVVVTAADRAAALKAICGMSETDYNVHLMHATFNGEDADPPKVVATGSLAKQAIAAAAGAIAFIRVADIDDSVKVLSVNGKTPGQPGYPLSQK